MDSIDDDGDRESDDDQDAALGDEFNGAIYPGGLVAELVHVTGYLGLKAILVGDFDFLFHDFLLYGFVSTFCQKHSWQELFRFG